MARKMDLGFISLLMEIFMRVNFSKGIVKEKVAIHGLIRVFTKDSGLLTR